MLAAVSRLGDWTPTTIEERLDRMESLADIRQLPHRYALCLDSRDMDTLVTLFPVDVRVGKDQTGRDALKRWFTDTMSQLGASVHLVANHIIDFDDADHARGTVYCHDEIHRPETGEWQWGQLLYRDTYVRVDGEWFFERRRFHRWYMVDALERPRLMTGDEDINQMLTTDALPGAFPTWNTFWERVDQATS
jgi:hypothetical protein